MYLFLPRRLLNFSFHSRRLFFIRLRNIC
jgi:hypothetical protein